MGDEQSPLPHRPYNFRGCTCNRPASRELHHGVRAIACFKMGDVGWDESTSPTKDFPGVLLGLEDSAQPTLKDALAVITG
jgi:hypothetical protein